MRGGADQRWASYVSRYAKGEWRARIFRDMVLADAQVLKDDQASLAILDIGCGGGFDDDKSIQEEISHCAGQYIGIEPDQDIELGKEFTSVCRCTFENADIAPASIDIAFAVMVLEHIQDPALFWDKVHKVLKPGGVFWGFTVDARNWFVGASTVTEKLGIKDRYLDALHGKKGEERYENYGVFYRTNRPSQVRRYADRFSEVTSINLTKVGQLDFYLPRRLKRFGRILDRIAMRVGWPGAILVVRARK